MVFTKGLEEGRPHLLFLGSVFPFLLTGKGLPLQEGIFLLGSCIAIYGAIFLVWILIAVWVYRDATARGMSGGVWVLIVLLIGIIGLIVYLVVRTDKPPAPVGAYPQPGPYGVPPAGTGPADDAVEDAPEGSKPTVHFMGIGAGEKWDKVPIINKVPTSMRVIVVILVVAVVIMAVSALSIMVGSDDKPSPGSNRINPAKLDDFYWPGEPIPGSMTEYSETSTDLRSMVGQNQTLLVDTIIMTLEWQDEPDQTWAGRTRENSADSFQLRIDLGHGNYTVESEMTPNDEGSKQGSVSLTFNVGMTNYTYVLVGSDTEGLDLPANVTDMGVDLAVIMGEAGDLYASGPALFKLNDFGNDYMLTVTVAGKIIP